MKNIEENKNLNERNKIKNAKINLFYLFQENFENIFKSNILCQSNRRESSDKHK